MATTILGTLVVPATAKAHQVGHLRKNATLKQQELFYQANVNHAKDVFHAIKETKREITPDWFLIVPMTVKQILIKQQHLALLRNAKRNLTGVMKKIAALPPPLPAGICWACWDRVASCESGQHWNDNTGNGFYGGLQFTISTWLRAGGGRYAPRADYATRVQQIIIASKLALSNWPVCGARY